MRFPTENALYEQVAQYLREKYPGVPYHFDLSGLWTPSHKARNLYGRVNQRAWPDLFVAKRAYGYAAEEDGRKTLRLGSYVYPGLFLELKKEGTRLKKRDGTWASLHVAEQAAMLDILAAQGYIAQFACGFDEAKQLIDSYMGAA